MSNQIAAANVVSMTSREIAELTGKQHLHVRRDVEKMIANLDYPNVDSQIKSTTYADSNGIQRPQYELDKEMTMTLVAGYNVRLRNAVIKRWLELEEQASVPKLPQTYLEALEAHLQSEKDKLALAAQIEQQRPKVEFAERLVDTDNTWTRRHAAKMIKVPQQKLNAWLKEIGHNENNRNAVPTQYAIDRGYQTVVVGEANGVSYAGPQITMKGLLYYANKWYKKAVPGDVIKNIERAEDEVQESFRLK